MNFYELEKIMSSHDVNTLADIARELETTPQAVSNWKARNQIPYHVVDKIRRYQNDTSSSLSDLTSRPGVPRIATSNSEIDNISLSDILLTLAEQLKIIILVPFILIFLAFTYVQFIQEPLYVSRATILIPEQASDTMGGLSGLASQFGVSIPTNSKADLSNPSFYPELLTSRNFAKNILSKEFYTARYKKKMPLINIITENEAGLDYSNDSLVTMALSPLAEIVDFNKDRLSKFSTITITTFEPLFAKALAEEVLLELEELNRYYKNRAISEKISFIEDRISSVRYDLEGSETRLKEFNERNRQISSPALQLDLGRLTQEVDVQKSIYLTLKQQLELAKIEEIQEASIIQILDNPHVPMGPSNKNLKYSIVLAGFLGIIIGVVIGFIRSYINNNDIGERKKLRRVRTFLKKKSKDIILDQRISGIVSILLIICLPIYWGHTSNTPVYFGRYSPILLLVNSVYTLGLLFSISLFFYLYKKNKSN